MVLIYSFSLTYPQAYPHLRPHPHLRLRRHPHLHPRPHTLIQIYEEVNI